MARGEVHQIRLDAAVSLVLDSGDILRIEEPLISAVDGTPVPIEEIARLFQSTLESAEVGDDAVLRRRFDSTTYAVDPSDVHEA